MMSASAMSAAIRAKKKKMEEQESGAVKLSGIPEDATDIEAIKMHEAGEALSDNSASGRDEDPSLASQMAATKSAQPHNEESPDPKQINQPEDGEREKRNAKIRKMMGRMSK